jgi:spermidine synthase
MQSGPFLERIWKKGVLKAGLKQLAVKNALVLGLGGGSFVRVINQLFPAACTDAVDIDPVIVAAGRKYLSLDQSPNLSIHIADAREFVGETDSQYDLIFVDLYNGYDIPAFVEDESFLKKIRQLKTEKGVVIFNRLYVQKHIFEADKFLDKLAKIFKDRTKIRIYPNLLIIAR